MCYAHLIWWCHAWMLQWARIIFFPVLVGETQGFRQHQACAGLHGSTPKMHKWLCNMSDAIGRRNCFYLIRIQIQNDTIFFSAALPTHHVWPYAKLSRLGCVTCPNVCKNEIAHPWLIPGCQARVLRAAPAIKSKHRQRTDMPCKQKKAYDRQWCRPPSVKHSCIYTVCKYFW